MIATQSDRNLLFGLLALQNHFIDQSDLIAAFHEWTRDKARPIETILRDRGAISEADCRLLDSLLRRHVEIHGGSTARSLAAVSAPIETRNSLRQVAEADSDLAASLRIAAEPDDPDSGPNTDADPDPDSYRTHYGTAGAAAGDAGVRFRRLRPHARGGLGEVFVAHDRELNREVALKEILEQHADDASSRSRFVVEAEITGGLEHPGIVPVYGLGTYADGRPFYAMRFIKGDSLAEAIRRFHADEALRRDPGERAVALQKLLRRFLDVCNAVAYAHSRHVLHRDLKPGNIMVGKYGETIVVDWGLAKPLDRPEEVYAAGGERPLVPSSGSGSDKTLPGKAIGTPQYMSPEQAAGELDRLGPASDVYSLGSTLYHLLTGRAPFLDQDLGELLRKVRSGDFPPPTAEAGVPRPLEAICLKAMSVRPEDRYATPLEMAADIEHWLADEPVTALPEGAWARAARWARRHRAATQAGAIALLAVAVAASVTAVAINESRNRVELALTAETAAKTAASEAATNESIAREAAQEAEAQAKFEAATSMRITEFLVRMFGTVDPIGFDGVTFRGTGESSRHLTAGEILDKGARRVLETLKEEPLVQAKLLTTIGDVYRSMGLFDQARPLLERGLEVRRAQGGGDLILAESYHFLGMLAKDQAKFDEAERDFRLAIELRSKALGDRAPPVAESQFFLAWVLADQGDLAESEGLFRRVIEAHMNVAGRERELAFARLGLAGLLIEQSRSTEATPYLVAASLFLLAREGLGEVGEAIRQFQVGAALNMSGSNRLAEFALRRGLVTARRALPKDHPYLGFFLYELATSLAKQDKDVEAEAYYRECLDLMRKTVTLAYPRTMRLVDNYAMHLAKARRPDEGRKLLDESIKAVGDRYGPEHHFTAEAIANRADYLWFIGDQDGSERSYREAVAIFKRHPEKGGWVAAYCLKNFGSALATRGKGVEAESVLREALAMTESGSRGDKQADSAYIHDGIGVALASQSRHDEAEREIVDAIARHRALSDPRPRTLSLALKHLSRLHSLLGRYERCDAPSREFLEIDRREFGPDKEVLIQSIEERAAILVALGRAGEARPLFKEAAALRSKIKAPEELRLAFALRNDAFSALLAGDLDGYRAGLARLRDRFKDAKNPDVLLCVAFAWTAGPSPADGIAPVIELVGSRLDVRTNAQHMKAFGSLRYRAGDLEAAAKILEEAKAAAKGETDGFLLAMALHRTGQGERAKGAYRESVAWAEKQARVTPGVQTPFLWDGRARLERLRVEAAGVLGIDPAASP